MENFYRYFSVVHLPIKFSYMRELLEIQGHVGTFVNRNGQILNYGVIFNENGKIIHWTGKGLREAFPINPDEDQKKRALEILALLEANAASLIASGHIAVTPHSEIVKVIS